VSCNAAAHTAQHTPCKRVQGPPCKAVQGLDRSHTKHKHQLGAVGWRRTLELAELYSKPEQGGSCGPRLSWLQRWAHSSKLGVLDT
jgi:hypothetical protein